MDRRQFDALARLVAATTSRRIALGALVSAAPLRREPDPAQAKRKGKGKGKKKSKRGNGPCYPGKGCIPGAGQDNVGCDFSGSDVFNGLNAQGSQLRHTNFIGADLRDADLSGSDLGGSCLLGADLTGANLDGAKTKGAIFCGTTLPDGSIDDSGCDKGTRCCPAEPPEDREEEPEEEQCEICPQRYCCHCEGGLQDGLCRLFDFDPDAPINIGIFCAQICVQGTPQFLFVDSNNANFCDTSNRCVQLACPIS